MLSAACTKAGPSPTVNCEGHRPSACGKKLFVQLPFAKLLYSPKWNCWNPESYGKWLILVPNLKVCVPCDQETLSMYWNRFCRADCGQQKSPPTYALGRAEPGKLLASGVCERKRCQKNRASLITCGVRADISPTFKVLSCTTVFTRPLGSVFGPVCTSKLAFVSRCKL